MEETGNRGYDAALAKEFEAFIDSECRPWAMRKSTLELRDRNSAEDFVQRVVIEFLEVVYVRGMDALSLPLFRNLFKFRLKDEFRRRQKQENREVRDRFASDGEVFDALGNAADERSLSLAQDLLLIQTLLYDCDLTEVDRIILEGVAEGYSRAEIVEILAEQGFALCQMEVSRRLISMSNNPKVNELFPGLTRDKKVRAKRSAPSAGPAASGMTEGDYENERSKDEK